MTMSRWVVQLEFVPIEGAKARTDEAVLQVAAALREQFRAHEAAAHGNTGRLVVSAKVDAETDEEAEGWARQKLYDAVTNLLPDWRLDRLEAWQAA